MRRLSALVFTVLLASGCASTTVQTANSNSLRTANLDKVEKVALIPIKIEVKESGLGSLEKLPEESEQATKIVNEELVAALSGRYGVEVVLFEPENEEQKILLDDYVGLYQRVAGAAQNRRWMGPAWNNRSTESFDYSVGEGLGFIEEKLGVDKAIFLYGEDIVTSAGVKATAILAMAVGVGVNPGGVAVLHLGVVDIDNGHLLWTNTTASQGLSLDKNKSVKGAFDELLLNGPFKSKSE